MFYVGSISGSRDYQRDIPDFAAAKIAARRVATQLGTAVAVYDAKTYRCIEIVHAC